ncbi:hypothetical protein ABK040_007853 [Willaertia magna]
MYSLSASPRSIDKKQSPLFKRSKPLETSIGQEDFADTYSASVKPKGRYLSPLSKERIIQLENEIFDNSLVQENDSLIYDRLFSSMEREKQRILEQEREKKWNPRFYLDPMPRYNVLNDKHSKFYTTSSIFQERQSILAMTEERNPSPKKYMTDKYETVRPYTNHAGVPLIKRQKRTKSAQQSRRAVTTDNKRLSRSEAEALAAELMNFQKTHSMDIENSMNNGNIMSKPISKPPLTPKRSLAEMEAEHIFLKAKSSIQKLWAELRIPKTDREKFTKIYFSQYSNDNLTLINEEIKRLTEQRNLILSILKQIENRESLLETLKSIVDRYGDEKLISKHLAAREVKNIITSIRVCTIEIVESIVQWRHLIQAQRPFIWKSKNYLLKIQTDLDFFINSSLISLLPSINHDNNPFLMPGTEFGQSNDNETPLTVPNYLLNGKKRPKFDPSPYLNGMPLPPLSKIRQPVPTQNDPLKERILIAQRVVLAEGKQVEQIFKPITYSIIDMEREIEEEMIKEELISKEKLTKSQVKEPLHSEVNYTQTNKIKETKEKQKQSKEKSKNNKSLPENKKKTITKQKVAKKIKPKTIGKEQNASVVESAVRGYLSRKQYRNDIVETLLNEASLILQGLHKGVNSRKEFMEEREQSIKQHEIVTILQSVLRGEVSRRDFTEKLNIQREREAISLIQAVSVAAVNRLSLLKELSKIEEEKKLLEEATTILQSLIRSFMSKKDLSQQRKKLSEKEIKRKRSQKAAIIIQKHIRRYLASIRVKKISDERKILFLGEIEKEKREYEELKRQKKLRKQEQATAVKSATKIQSAIRKFLAIRRAKRISEERNKAFIEEIEKEKREYEEMKALKRKRKQAAIKIQCLIRKIISKNRASKLRELKRHLLADDLKEEAQLNDAVETIQTSFRGLAGRHLALEKKEIWERKNAAAKAIQTSIRKRIASNKARTAKEIKDKELSEFLEEEKKMYSNVDVDTL